MSLNLTTEPEIVTLPPSILAYVEKRGPFLKYAPLAWQEFVPLMQKLAMNEIEAGVGLSRIDPTLQGDDAFIYQAGVFLKSQPQALPDGLKLRTLEQGRYASFLLSGSYSQLPQAYPAAFAKIAQSTFKMRQDFCIEKYLNNPTTTPEAELKTAIMIPIL